jgi:hypothetical protein
LKPEWWGSRFVDEEKYQEKENTVIREEEEEIIIIIPQHGCDCWGGLTIPHFRTTRLLDFCRRQI